VPKREYRLTRPRTTGDRYLVIIDGKLHPVIIVDSGKEETLRLSQTHKGSKLDPAEPVPRVWGWVTLAKGLPPGPHTLKLWKLSEANYVGEYPWQYGAAAFGGFQTDGEFLPPPAPPTRRLTFIGGFVPSSYMLMM